MSVAFGDGIPLLTAIFAVFLLAGSVVVARLVQEDRRQRNDLRRFRWPWPLSRPKKRRDRYR